MDCRRFVWTESPWVELDPSAMDLRDAVHRVLCQARTMGASDAEVVAAEGDHLEVGVRLGEVEKLKRARERRLALRLFMEHSSAMCSTADLAESSLSGLVEECSALAHATAPDPYCGLPGTDGPIPTAVDLDLYDTTAESMTAEEGLALARAAEGAALDADRRITNSEGAEFNVDTRRLLYGTSRGVFGEYRTSSYSLTVVPVGSHDGTMQQDYWYTSARHRADLEPPETVGRQAAERVLRRLGARSVPTREVPVIFDSETAASLVGHLATAVSGSSVYRGTSFLQGRLGETLGPPGLTVVDDPLLTRGLGSRPFDAEGVSTRKNVVIENGVLRTYLLDSYSARKLGLRTTGSAVRSLGEAPSAGISNFYLQNGNHDPANIIASVCEGLYVTDLIGFGVNPVTGDYSRGAAGIWIRNGRPAFPVHEVTIAGNLLDMFRSIEMVGNDLRFRATTASPTLKIARMTIAGEG